MPSSKVVRDLDQLMVSQFLCLEDVSNRYYELAFTESAVQYPRGKIGPPPGGLPKPLRSKALKYHNLDPLEGHPRAKLGEYKFDKAAEELRSKYVLSEISDKNVLINWKD